MTARLACARWRRSTWICASSASVPMVSTSCAPSFRPSRSPTRSISRLRPRAAPPLRWKTRWPLPTTSSRAPRNSRSTPCAPPAEWKCGSPSVSRWAPASAADRATLPRSCWRSPHSPATSFRCASSPISQRSSAAMSPISCWAEPPPESAAAPSCFPCPTCPQYRGCCSPPASTSTRKRPTATSLRV